MELPANRFISVATSILALLWLYAAVSKLIEFSQFEVAMHSQTIWPAVQGMLIYGLPPAEIAVGIFLIFPRTTMFGLYSSAYFFLLFTIYIALVLTRVFGKVPCSCGGLIQHMGWTFHLFFNIAFFVLTLITIFIYQRKEFRDTR